MDSARIQGSCIRLISKSEIRYEGTLSSIDPVANTVSLKNVRMHGTEGRPAEHQIPPSDALYDFIIFRGSDIKDLTVYEQKPKTDFIDPAVVSAQPAARQGGKGMRRGNDSYNQQPQQGRSNFGRSEGGRGMYDTWGGNDRQMDRHHDRYGGGGGGYNNYNNYGRHERRNYSGNYNNEYRGGKGGGNRRPRSNSRTRDNPLATHTGMNFKVTDEQKAEEKRKMSGIEGEFNFEEAKIDMNKVKEENKEVIEIGYDKKKSFFDSLSCETTERQKGEPQRLTKTMRENNHKQDVETFGADAVTAIERSFTRQRGHRNGGRGQSRGRGRGYGRGGGRGPNRRGRW